MPADDKRQRMPEINGTVILPDEIPGVGRSSAFNPSDAKYLAARPSKSTHVPKRLRRSLYVLIGASLAGTVAAVLVINEYRGAQRKTDRTTTQGSPPSPSSPPGLPISERDPATHGAAGIPSPPTSGRADSPQRTDVKGATNIDTSGKRFRRAKHESTIKRNLRGPATETPAKMSTSNYPAVGSASDSSYPAMQ